uniref:NKAP domain containing 1 n=1 Tax=Saimiri boliviensis boliviensis TaxID=39432 RepID=A0A2K6SZR0_SAIBB
MYRIPLGKVLLRNAIRHTDAHNKIQEESDMWKIRELEKQMEDAYRGTKRKMLPSSSSRMRSDGFDEESQRDYWRPKNEISGTLEDDFLKAKSWNKKLYDYEANMPDRWGHSGYKELYPEEFETDSSDQQDITNGKKTSPQVKSSTHESRKHKKSKKSHKKKQKKSKKEAMDITADSSSELSEETGASSTRQKKQPHKLKKKSRKKSLKKPALFLEAESNTSHSDDSASSSSEESEERDTKKTKRKKREKKVHTPVANNEIQERTNKRTNWKVATDERSAESSEDD